MARQEISLGVLPNGVGGDTPRTANTKINDMTTELYAELLKRLPLTGGAMAGAINFADRLTLATAATVNLGQANSNSVLLSGAGTISSFGPVASGVQRQVRFSGAVTLVSGPNLVLPGGVNFTTGSGDTALFEAVSADIWRMTSCMRANGAPAAFTSVVGVVSQAAGAIMERGITANGSYLKLACGTIFMWKRLVMATGSNIAFGQIFGSSSVAGGPLPYSTVDAPSITATGTDGSGGGWAANDVFPSASSWGSYSTRNATSTPNPGVILLFGVGSWY